MRTPILILTAATVLGLTVTVLTAAGTPGTDPTQKSQVRSGGVGGNPQEGGFLRGYDRLAKGDMSGTGGGGKKGGMMGDMMGGMGKGKQ